MGSGSEYGSGCAPTCDRSPSSRLRSATSTTPRSSRASRAVQRMLFDAGLAGLVFPREYGGRGLPPEYQRAYAEEAKDYEQAFIFQEPTLNILAPTLLDFGTEEQKRTPPAGDPPWRRAVGAVPLRAVERVRRREHDDQRRAESTVVGSSTDRRSGAAPPTVPTGRCARRAPNWDVPKHHGLTMFLVPIQQPGIEVHRIRTADGNAHFCQEFLTDVFVADDDVLGDVDRGWSVILGLIGHERLAVGGASPFTGGTRPMPLRGPNRDLLHLAQRCGRDHDPVVRQVVGADFAASVVKEQLSKRVVAALRDGDLPDTAGAMLRLYEGLASRDQATAARDIVGARGGHGGGSETTSRGSASSSSCGRRRASVVGRSRWRGTRSRSECSGCRVSSRPTAASPSATSCRAPPAVRPTDRRYSLVA